MSSVDKLFFDLLVSQRAGLLFKSSLIEITGNKKQRMQINAVAAAKLLFLRGKESAGIPHSKKEAVARTNQTRLSASSTSGFQAWEDIRGLAVKQLNSFALPGRSISLTGDGMRAGSQGLVSRDLNPNCSSLEWVSLSRAGQPVSCPKSPPYKLCIRTGAI